MKLLRTFLPLVWKVINIDCHSKHPLLSKYVLDKNLATKILNPHLIMLQFQSEMVSFFVVLFLLSINSGANGSISRYKRQTGGATIFLGLKVGFLKGLLAGQAVNPNGYGYGYNGINGRNPFLGRARATERTYEFVRATYDDEREREDVPLRTTPLPRIYSRRG